MSQAPVQRIQIDAKGIARIAGSRSRVSQIVVDHGHMSPEEIVATFPHLTLADVYAALAYYYDHKAEIDREIARADELDELQRQKQEGDPQFQERVAKLKARWQQLHGG